jgi:hypothetical protein
MKEVVQLELNIGNIELLKLKRLSWENGFDDYNDYITTVLKQHLRKELNTKVLLADNNISLEEHTASFLQVIHDLTKVSSEELLSCNLWLIFYTSLAIERMFLGADIIDDIDLVLDYYELLAPELLLKQESIKVAELLSSRFPEYRTRISSSLVTVFDGYRFKKELKIELEEKERELKELLQSGFQKNQFSSLKA